MAELVSDLNYAPLSTSEIETINAHGPYDLAKWVGRGVVVTSEDRLAGKRGELLAELVRGELLKRYSTDELAAKTITDVGCYDGFILHQLSDLPFRRLVGFEPREKNIAKGRTIRDILGIETRCEFRRAGLDEVSEEFDIVISTGLIHHLSSPAAGIKKLRSICRDFIFIETLVLPDHLMTPEFRDRMELKDLPYSYGETFIGLTGHKIESGYLDGSAASYSLVSVPSVSALTKYFELSGFVNVKAPLSMEEYTASIPLGDHRLISAICLTADAAAAGDDERRTRDWILDYETGMLCTVLPLDISRELYAALVLESCVCPESAITLATLKSVRSKENDTTQLKAAVSDRFVFEILKNMRFNGRDKAALEFAKSLLNEGSSEEGLSVLRAITQRLNADWRTVFRAFALLARQYDVTGDEQERDRYRKLCLSANPQFPLDLLHGRPLLV